MKLVKWITTEDACDKEENGLGGIGGFFADGMRWKDYLNKYKKDAWPMLEQLRASIIKHRIRCTGEMMQESGCCVVPLWDNGKVDTYSWRGWGDLMAAVWSEEDNQDYSYMTFYM